MMVSCSNYTLFFYRNVGPWKYYNLSQIPNFLIAAPTLIVCISLCIIYCRFDWIRCMTLGLKKSKTNRLKSRETDIPFMMQDIILPHVFLMLFMISYALILVHVQIVARLFSFQPFLYWSLAHLFINGSNAIRHGIIYCVLGFVVVGTPLFMNFYPPA